MACANGGGKQENDRNLGNHLRLFLVNLGWEAASKAPTSMSYMLQDFSSVFLLCLFTDGHNDSRYKLLHTGFDSGKLDGK